MIYVAIGCNVTVLGNVSVYVKRLDLLHYINFYMYSFETIELALGSVLSLYGTMVGAGSRFRIISFQAVV